MELRGLQGCHALRLGPRACRVVSETSAFGRSSVWIPFHHGSRRARAVEPERCAAGIKPDGSRSNAGHQRRRIRDVSLRTSASTALAWLPMADALAREREERANACRPRRSRGTAVLHRPGVNRMHRPNNRATPAAAEDHEHEAAARMVLCRVDRRPVGLDPAQLPSGDARGVRDCDRQLAALHTVCGPSATAHRPKLEIADLHARDDGFRAGTVDVRVRRAAHRSARAAVGDRRRGQEGNRGSSSGWRTRH